MLRAFRGPVLVVLTVAGLAAAAPALGAPLGAISQLALPAGCHAPDDTDGCTVARATNGMEALAQSPDGKHVYSYSYTSGAIGVYARNAPTGALEQLAGLAGCLSADGTGGDCTDTRGPSSAGDTGSIAVSPDGRFVYAGGTGGQDVISAFSRDPETGALTQLAGVDGCVSQTGADGDAGMTCQVFSRLDAPNAFAIDPEGKNLYVSMEAGLLGLAVFRIESDGGLTPLDGTAGCISDDGASPAGANTCTPARGIGAPGQVKVSPDGRHVYLANDAGGSGHQGIAAFSRDAATGALTQLDGKAGCTTVDGSSSAGADTCADGRAVNYAYVLALSPDGRNLYAGGVDSPGLLAVFTRDIVSGALTQLDGKAGCLTGDGSSEDGADTCANGRGLGSHYGIAASPDGRTIYTASYSGSSEGIGIFARGAGGALTQLEGLDGCVSPDGSSDDGAATCATATGIAGMTAAMVSHDGRFFYGGAYGDDVITVFSRTTGTAPSCTAAEVSVPHNTATAITLACSDADGDALARSIVSGPGSGTLGAIDGASVTYTPAAGFSGDTTFTFRATDVDGASAPATVTLHVAAAPPPVTTPPVTTPPEITAPLGTLGKIRANLRTLARTGKLVVPVTSNEPASIVARLLVRKTTAKKAKLAAAKVVRIGQGKGRLDAAGSTKVTVRLTKKAKRGVKRVKQLKATVRVVLRDAAGNRATIRRSLTLRR